MPIYALVDTWNSAGTVFTGIGLNVTDTASAAGSLLLDLQVGGVSVFRVAKSGIARFVDRASARDLQIEVSTTGAHHRFFSSNTSAGFQFENNATVLGTFSSTTGLGIGNGSDLFLTRDAADTLAQRRGTNAQAFRIYGTYTDASNYERVFIGAGGGNFQIYTQNAGSGVAKELQFGTNNGVQWKLNSGGHFLAGADNTYDIGASGANRPRNLYVAGRAVIDTLTIGLGGQTSVATNTALGVQALHSASLTGVQTVAVGNFAGNSLTTGGSSVFVGHGAGQNVTTGTENTAVGRLSLSSATTANYNTAIGQNALLYYNTSNNTAIGHKAAQGSTTVANNTGSDLTAVGYQALLSNTTGSFNTAVGVGTLSSNTTGSRNGAFGYIALQYNTTGGFNNAVGYQALNNNTTGSGNTAMGDGALLGTTTASNNSALGYLSLAFNVTGANNSALGASALRYFNTSNNTAVGYEAARGSTTVANNTGNNLTAVGYQALTSNTSGGSNSALGLGALLSNTTGSNNSAVGVNALFENTTGSNSTAVGRQAAERFVANSNTALGYRALRGGDATPANNTGTNNIAIGFQAGDAITTGSTNIVIGHDIDVDSPTANNQINVGGVYFHDRLLYTERADPAAPAANQAVVYARDNGSGKTQLCVRFNTGAVQVLATEP
jgi:hypothetical protein